MAMHLESNFVLRDNFSDQAIPKLNIRSIMTDGSADLTSDENVSQLTWSTTLDLWACWKSSIKPVHQSIVKLFPLLKIHPMSSLNGSRFEPILCPLFSTCSLKSLQAHEIFACSNVKDWLRDKLLFITQILLSLAGYKLDSLPIPIQRSIPPSLLQNLCMEVVFFLW